MKLYSPAFERKVWRRIRPQVRAAIKRHGRPGPGFWTRHRGAGRIAGTMIFVLFLSAVGAGAFARLFDNGWSDQGVRALVGLVFTWVVLVFRGLPAQALERRDLMPLYCLPASDDLIFRWSWRRMYTITCMVGVFVLTQLTALCLHRGCRWGEVPILIGVSVVAAFASLGLAVLPPRIPIGRFVLFAGFLLGATIFLFPVISPLARQFLNEYGPALDWLHPGGWLVLFADGSTISAPPDARALLALPLAALAWSTVSSRRYWRAQFDSTLQLAKWQDLRPLHGDALSPLDEEEVEEANAGTEDLGLNQSQTGDRAEVRAALESELRAALPRTGETRLDRWLGPELDSRAALLMHVFPRRRPNSARQLRWLVVVLAAAWILAWLLVQFGLPRFSMCVLFGFGPLLALVPTSIGAKVSYAGVAAKHLPVGFREVARLNWGFGWRGLLLLLFPLAAYGGGAAWLLDRTAWPLGVCIAVKLVLYFAAIHPLWTVGQFSTGTRDVNSLRWKILLIIAGFSVVVVCCLAGLILVAFPGPFTALGLLPLAAITWAFQAFYGRTWSRRWFDLAPPPGQMWN